MCFLFLVKGTCFWCNVSLLIDMQFIEGGSEDLESGEERTDDDSSADDEPEDHQQKVDELNELDVRKLDSLRLIEEVSLAIN